MANSEAIKTTIDANINTNGNQSITGAVMNSVLKQMVDSTDAQFSELSATLDNKQEQLVSGENIKTINGQSILGKGDIEINNDAPEIYGDTYINTEVSGISVYLSANVAETLDEVTERGKLADAYDIKSQLTELSAKVATLEAQVKELMEKADTTAILGKAKLGYAVLS